MKRATIFLLAVLCAACQLAEPQLIRRGWPVMGTLAAVTFRVDGERIPEREVESVRRVVQEDYTRLEGLLSAWNGDSELTRLAKLPVAERVARASEEVRPCYRMADRLAEDSGGAFNPAIGTRLRELGVGQGTYSDYDLGAIAKGFAVDVAYAHVVTNTLTGSLLLDLGGNLRAVKGEWITGIRNPFGQGLAARFKLRPGEAVATSGNYERFIDRDGERLSHILDGRSGTPVRGIAGCTVLAPTAMLADGLSTTLFVLGPEEGSAFLARHHPYVEALWIPDTPNERHIVATSSFVSRLEGVTWPVTSL